MSRYDLAGNFLGFFISRVGAGMSDFHWGGTFGPDGNLYVADYFGGFIGKFNGSTGEYLGPVCYVGAPVYIKFGPDGFLYVAANGGSEVVRFNAATGNLVDVPVPGGTPNLGAPQDLVFGADGKLYISTFGTNAVLRYDPKTGATETFVQPNSGGLSSARQMAFGPDGNLYVSSQDTNSVKRYSGTDGQYLGDFVAPGTVSNNLALAFSPDGRYLFAAGNVPPEIDATGAGGVGRYDGHTGAFIDYVIGGDSTANLIFNTGRTQPGNNVPVSPLPTATLTFTSITATGQTVVNPLNSATAPLPINFEVSAPTGGIAIFFDISTTATFSGAIELAIAYDAAQFPYVAGAWTNGQPYLVHDPGSTGAWSDNATNNWVAAHGSDVTINGNHILNGVDPVNHKVYGTTTGLSPFAVVRRHVFSWSGVLQPINSDGSSVFKQGSTIPVKFKLTGRDAGITNLQAKLYVAKMASVPAISANNASSTNNTESGNTFRCGGGQYIFNLSTKNLAQGTWYLRVDLGDGVDHIVKFTIK